MMKLLFIGMAFFACCQFTYAQQDYFAYQSPKRTIIFRDNFDNNHNHWDTGSSREIETNIREGELYLTARKGAFGVWQPIDIDTTKDFEIEAGVRFIEGENSHKHFSSMLFWGRDSLNANYLFFSSDGFCSISSCTRLTKCKEYPRSLLPMHLNKKEFNKYTIIKKGNAYYFFVNEVYFYSMPFVPFYGNHVGIGAAAGSTIAIDYLSVSYL